MKVRQSSVVEKLRGQPGGLEKFFEKLRKGGAKQATTVSVDGKTYVIRKSPPLTQRVGY